MKIQHFLIALLVVLIMGLIIGWVLKPSNEPVIPDYILKELKQHEVLIKKIENNLNKEYEIIDTITVNGVPADIIRFRDSTDNRLPPNRFD